MSQQTSHDSGIATEEQTKTQEPSKYKVLLHNDDYTPMDFVVHVLKKYFNRSDIDATEIMLQVHHKGIGVAGVFTYEVAETKISQVELLAKKNEYPLRLSMQKE